MDARSIDVLNVPYYMCVCFTIHFYSLLSFIQHTFIVVISPYLMRLFVNSKNLR